MAIRMIQGPWTEGTGTVYITIPEPLFSTFPAFGPLHRRSTNIPIDSTLNSF